MVVVAGMQAPGVRFCVSTFRLPCWPFVDVTDPVNPAAFHADRAFARVLPTRFGTVRHTGVGGGEAVGFGVGAGVRLGVGAGVGLGVRAGVGFGVAAGVAVGAGVPERGGGPTTFPGAAV